MEPHPDRELVRQTLAGHDQAFGMLVDRYQDSLYRYVLHMGFAEADARDILQDAFIRAYRHLDRCGDPDRFGGWIFTITANLCRTQGKKVSKRTLSSLDDVSIPDEHPTPEQDAEQASLRDHVRSALSHLPDDQRQAVVEFYLHDLGVREIAAHMDASPSAVKMKLLRARAALRAELAPLHDEVGLP
jgi:RNA polymerase sigma-70 factor (ECF subfamily)